MLISIAIIVLMLFGNLAMAETAPADTLAESSTLTTIKNLLNEIAEVQIEINKLENDAQWQPVTFSYPDAGFKQVSLVGSFTGWVHIPMEKKGDDWTLTIALPEDQQYYLFSVVDKGETWEAIDPDNRAAINHKDFGWVSVLEINDHETKDSAARKAEHRKRREHRRTVIRELEYGQGIADVVSYQRVDGLFLNPSVNIISSAGKYDASVRLQGNFGFSSGRLGGGITVLKPLIRPYALSLKFSMFDRTMPNNSITGIGNMENSLAAFFLHEDYRDYHRSKGLNASLVFKVGKWLRIESGVRRETHASLGTPSIWAMKDGEFSQNPLIDDGQLRSAFFNLSMGNKHSYIRATYERSGDDFMGGDFEFERVTAAMRGRLKLGDDSGFNARIAAGANLQGQLPAQRRLLLGGLGTVRGYGYQSLLVVDPDQGADPSGQNNYGGDKCFLGNLEYYFRLLEDFHMSVFYDAGMVWQNRHAETAFDQLKTSAGIGFNFDSTDGPRLDIIKRLDDKDAPYVLQFRLKRSF